MLKPKKKQKKSVTVGIANIKTTFNNTIISITDLTGNVISWASAGKAGYIGSLGTFMSVFSVALSTVLTILVLSK